MELHKESNQREQSRHRDWNPDRGSRNKIPGGWQSVGDYGADRDEYVGGVGHPTIYRIRAIQPRE